MHKRSHKDILLIISVLIIAVILWAGNSLFRKPAVLARITVDGRLVKEFSLNQDQEYLIQGYAGGSNHLVIQDGLVSIDGADCPDQVCVRQGPVSRSGEVIVCMPHRVMVQITDSGP